MNKLNIYAIHDSKAETFNTPFFLLNDEVAIRSMQSIINDPTTDLSRNPEDYNLFLIGEYETEKAKLTSHEPIHVLSLIELKNEPHWTDESVTRLIESLKAEYQAVVDTHESKIDTLISQIQHLSEDQDEIKAKQKRRFF